MRINPIVRKKMDTIKDEQMRKDCYFVFYGISIGASPELFYRCGDQVRILKEFGFIELKHDWAVATIQLFIEPLKSDNIFENTEIDRVVNARIEEYRNLFKGKRVGSMGDKEACKSKMVRWMNKNPEFSFDDILAATEYYINRTSPTYITQADYFIYKANMKKEEISKLSSILDEIDVKKVGVDPFEQNL